MAIPSLEALFVSIVEADRAIRPIASVTPVVHSPGLSELTGCDVWLKCEHLQTTGSFKLRGAVNAMRQLGGETRCAGVVTASSGNHGLGVAVAGAALGIPVTIFVSTHASPTKRAAIERLGASLNIVEGDSLAAENTARAEALRRDVPYISPYNDEAIIAGQGTVGLELAGQVPGLAATFVSVGGGGLAAGIGAALWTLAPGCKLTGCWPESSPALERALAFGRVVDVDEQPTLSDGTAGGIEVDTITLPLCQMLVSHRVLVSEDAIRTAMRVLAREERWMVEGAAGVALAGLLATCRDYAGQRVAVVLCGRNIGIDTFVEAVG